MLRPAKKAPAQKAHSENPMNTLHYIGFDVHKKTISFCVKTAAGEIVEEGSATGATRGLAAMGLGAAAALAGSDGSDPVQRLDLRHAEALRRAVGDGASGENESHQRGQEEKRHHRRPHHRRPGALQSVARLLCGGAANPRTAAPVALPQPGGERSRCA